MKLVRENINEKFTEDSDPIEDIGIGSKHLIHKWFDSVGVDRSRYTIDDDLNIYFRGNLDLQRTRITKLPNNLKVGGWLNLEGTSIRELPDNLRVKGGLNLQRTQITKLPDNLRVGGYLDARETQIKKFPRHLAKEKII